MSEKTQVNIESGGFIFCNVRAEDKESFMPLFLEANGLEGVGQKDPDFKDDLWKWILRGVPELHMMVLDSDNNHLANCSLQSLDSTVVKIGLDVMKERRNQGLGRQILVELNRVAHQLLPDKEIVAEVRKENLASLHAIEAAGGVFVEAHDTPEAAACRGINSMLNPERDKNEYRKNLEIINAGANGVLVYKIQNDRSNKEEG